MHALHSKKLYNSKKFWLILCGLIICVISLLIFVNASFADQNTDSDSVPNNSSEELNDADYSYLKLHHENEYWELHLRKEGYPDNIKLQWCKAEGSFSEYQWYDFDEDEEIFPKTIDADIYIRGINNSSLAKSPEDYWYFEFYSSSLEYSVEISGNIMSLLDCYNPPTAINSDYCFFKLFNNMKHFQCVNLSLPNNVRPHCYESMFEGCVDLTTPPNLPATNLTYKDEGKNKDATACYANMFKGCTSLATTPDLPATNLVDSCYQGMFSGTAVKSMRIDTDIYSGNYCCESMFLDCEQLTSAKISSPISVGSYCFSNMFKGCTSLSNLGFDFKSLQTLKEGCFKGMFCGSAIKTPVNLQTNDLAPNCYESMFQDCDQLTALPTISKRYIAPYCCANMFKGCSKITNASSLNLNFDLSDVRQWGIRCEGCYQGMFAGSGLTSAPQLPAAILAENCYKDMFNGCTALQNPPELPATSLAESCYEGMFQIGTEGGLTSAPDLPATTLAKACYKNMFNGCTAITDPPVLNATSLADNCYERMFSASGLIEAPELPANTLAICCYTDMFSDCHSMKKTPSILPASSLADCCYWHMFAFCTSITSGPDIPIVSSTPSAYLEGPAALEMFFGCEKLKHIKVEFTEWPTYGDGRSLFLAWMVGVSPTGYFECPDELDTSIRDESHIPEGWKLVNQEMLSFSTTEDTASISYNFEKAAAEKNVNLIYSKNCVDWTTLTVSESTSSAVKIAEITKDEKLFIYGANLTGFNDVNNCFSFVSEEKIKVHGNYLALLSLDSSETVPNAYCYKGLFKGCTGLTNALELPWTQLTEGCYQSMYEGCTNLENAPELPATTVTKNCYNSMFKGCSSLAEAPALAATALKESCYQAMFEGCESITLPADMAITSVEKNCCAYMFKGCIRLTKGPDLEPTELKDGCYMGMFEGCNALTALKVGFSEWFDDAQHYSFDHVPTFQWLKDTENLFMNAQQFYCSPDLDTDSIKDVSHVPDYWTVTKDTKITANITGYNDKYDGHKHKITVSVTSPSDADIKYKGPDDDDFKEANPEFTNAGTYTVEVKISKANYVTLQTSADVVIQKSTSGTMSIGSFEKFYSGAEPDYTATFNGLDITPVKGVDYVTYREPGEDVLENDGVYTVHAVWINNNSNFDVAEATGSLTIKKASAKLVADKNSMSEGEGMPTLTAHLEGARFGVDDLASDDYSVEPVNNGDGTYTLNPNLSEKGQRFLKNFNVEMVPSVLKVYSTGGGGGGGGTEVVTETVTEQLPGTTQEIVKTEKADDKVSYMGQNNSSEDNDSSPLSPIAIASLIANALLLAGLVFMALKFRKAL